MNFPSKSVGPDNDELREAVEEALRDAGIEFDFNRDVDDFILALEERGYRIVKIIS
jgi:hypothetical protein